MNNCGDVVLVEVFSTVDDEVLSGVETTDGIELDIGPVDERSDPGRDAMLDVEILLAIDAGEAVYCDKLDEGLVTTIENELELEVAEELDTMGGDSIPLDGSDDEPGRKLVSPVGSIGLMT